MMKVLWLFYPGNIYYKATQKAAGIWASIANDNMLDVANQLSLHGPPMVFVWCAMFKRNLKENVQIIFQFSIL